MSFSGKMAYKILKLMTTMIPSMKADFTDISKELEKAEKINAKSPYRFPSGKKAFYKELKIRGYPCLIMRSRKTKPKKKKGLLFIYGGITRQWKSELSIARRLGDQTGMDIWYPIYPSITEVNISVTISVLYDIYHAMVKKYGAENIAVVGDSMGGMFAAAMFSHINKQKLNVGMPKLFIGNSPAGVPDTYLYFAEELCAGNARAYRMAYEAAGVGDRLHIHIQPEMMHGYSCVPVFPESKESYSEAVRLLNEV